MVLLLQPSFAKGEVNPELSGRVDTAAYKIALATARNVVIRTTGGAINRAGLEFIGMEIDMAAPSRLRRFRFNATDTYMLEFGAFKMRVIRDDAHVTEAPLTITSVTLASPAAVQINAHPFAPGDDIEFSVSGMPRLNGRRMRVRSVLDANHITIGDIITGAPFDSTNFPAFISGTAARVYTLATPYAQADLATLKFVQSASVLTITHPTYPEGTLTRTGDAAWTLTNPTFAPTILPPTGVAGFANTTGGTAALYVVTATDGSSGEESLPSASITIPNSADASVNVSNNTITWNAVSNASSYSVYKAINGVYGFVGFTPSLSFNERNLAPVLTTTPPQSKNPFARGPITSVTVTGGGSGLAVGQTPITITTSTGSGAVLVPNLVNGVLASVTVADGGVNYAPGDTIAIAGGTQAHGSIVFTANPTAGDSITLNGVNWAFSNSSFFNGSTPIGASAGATIAVLAFNLNVNAPASAALSGASYSANGQTLTITYGVTGAIGNAYTLASSSGNGVCSGGTLTGGAAGSSGATATLNVSLSTGNNPACSTYYQQRQIRAGTNNAPDTLYYSKTGNFYNFATSTPSQADDAITARLTSREVNVVKHLVPIKDLLVFTAGGEWRVNSSGQGFSSSTMEQLSQSTWGCSDLEPIVIGLTVLFVPENRIGVRSFAYTYVSDAYQGNDLTLMSGHLFLTYPLLDWGYSRTPDPVIYGVRADGQATAFTFQEEQQVNAWTRWDTQGSFEAVDVVRPNSIGPDEMPYFGIKRSVNGQTVRYIERMHTRRYTDVRDCFFVDAGLSFDNPIAIVSVAPFEPVIVGAFNHGLTVGQLVDVYDIQWVPTFDDDDTETQPNQLNTQRFKVSIVYEENNVGLTNLDGSAIDTTAWNLYASGGTMRVPTQTVAGLDHLEGRVVQCLADGNVVENLTVLNGSVTLPFLASRIHIGLKYISDIETLDLEAPQGTIQGKVKRAASVTVRYNQSRGMFIGQNTGELLEVKQRQDEAMGDPTALFSGDEIKILSSAYNTHGRIFLRQRYPLPMDVLFIEPNMSVEP